MHDVPTACSRPHCEERLATVTELLRGWIWETDAEHRFTYMSESVRQFAGKAPEWHYGKTRQELGNLNADNVQHKAYLRQLDARENFGPIDLVRQEEHRAVHMRSIGVPLIDAAGIFVGYRGLAFDISSEVAQRIERERAEARTAAAERTSTMMRQAELVRSEFVSTMTQEVQNPLKTILTLLDGLAESRLDPDQAAMLDTSRSAGRTLLAHIAEMQAFALVGSIGAARR